MLCQTVADERSAKNVIDVRSCGMDESRIPMLRFSQSLTQARNSIAALTTLTVNWDADQREQQGT